MAVIVNAYNYSITSTIAFYNQPYERTKNERE